MPALISYAVPGERTSPRFAEAFAVGCRGRVHYGEGLLPGPVALFGSPARWAILQQAIAEQRTYYYGDHGYFGRFVYYRITKNGFQHDGRGHAPANRFNQFGRAIRPWRTTGRHVLVCPNSPGFMELHGAPTDGWLRSVRAHLDAVTDREIRVRWKRDAPGRPLSLDLRGCWAVVVYSSAAAIEALIAGVPVFVLAPWAAPARMGLDDLAHIERPFYPDDRHQFCANLAANQWTLPEIASGDAWRALRL